MYRALGFGSLALVIFTIIALLGEPASRNDYMAAIRAKHARLKELGSPKIIIIGGSNAAFGFDSQSLEQAFGSPVVNMGLHGSLGTHFMVEEILGEIGRGDIVLVSLEYSNINRPLKLDDEIYLAVDRYPAALQMIPYHQWPKVLSTIVVLRMQATWMSFIGSATPLDTTMIYTASNFNEYGDFLIPSSTEKDFRHDLRFGVHKDTEIPSRFWTLLDRLESIVHEQDGKVFYAWPAIARSTHSPEVDASIEMDFNAKGRSFIGKRERYILDDSLFLDTKYHTRSRGKEIRTKLLIKDLKAELAQ